MDFTIVVPTYNGSKRIQHCIEGIQNLTIPENLSYEIIFIDNNSTDNVVEIINQSNLSNYRIEKETTQGLFFARDRGIKESKSDWIFFIDDDIKVQPNWIIEFFKVINSNPLAGLIAAPLKFPKEYINLPFYIKSIKNTFAITEDNLVESCNQGFLCSMLCVNKKAYNWLLNNGFKQKLIGRGHNNNQFSGGEDIEFSLALKYTDFIHCITTNTYAEHYIDKSRFEFNKCLEQKKQGFTGAMLRPLVYGDRKIFQKYTSYYYVLLRSIYFYFKKFETKEETLLYRTEQKAFLKYLLKNKKAYQNFENEIKHAKWNKYHE